MANTAPSLAVMTETGGPRVKRRTVLIATGAGVIALAVPLTALPRLRDGGAPHGAALADVTLHVGRQPGEPEPQAPALPRGGPAGAHDRLLGAGHRRARELAEDRPCGGQPHVATISVEQHRADFLLEGLDARAERRLRHVESLGGAPEEQLLGEHDEALERAKVGPPQHHAPAATGGPG